MSTRIEKATCETCPYWCPAPDPSPNGFCHRRAPKCGPQGPESQPDDFAYMATTDWCGEHPDFVRPKPLKAFDDVMEAARKVHDALGMAEWATPKHAEQILCRIIARDLGPLTAALQAWEDVKNG